MQYPYHPSTFDEHKAKLSEAEVLFLDECLLDLEIATLLKPEEARNEGAKLLQVKLRGNCRDLKGAVLNSLQFCLFLEHVGHLLK